MMKSMWLQILAALVLVSLFGGCKDAVDPADVAISDTGDAGDSSEDATDVVDTGDSGDAVAADVADSSDAAETSDTADVTDTADTTDTSDVADTSDVSDTTDTSDATDATDSGGGLPPVVECGSLAPVNDGVCSVTAGDQNLLIRGRVLGFDAVFEGGSVLVNRGGLITCVGCDCSGDPAAAGATVISCPEAAISPGLINAHDHITYTQNDPGDWGDERYDHRHDWRRGIRGHNSINVSGSASGDEVRWGELRQLIAGTTTLVGSGAAAGILRNLDRFGRQEGIPEQDVDYNTFPLRDSGGILAVDSCSYVDSATAENFAAADDCFHAHVSEGIDNEARNEFLCLSGAQSGSIDVAEARSAFVHAIGLRAEDGEEMAAAGTAVIWSPRSNISLYGNTAPVTMYAAQGIDLALGTDWTPSGSMHILRELACAIYLNDNHLGGYFSDRQLWEMVTHTAARALGADDVIGSLQEGLYGDIAIFDAAGIDDPFTAVITAELADVHLVVRGGKPLYGETATLTAIPGIGTCESIAGGICEQSRSVCLLEDTDRTFSQLQSANMGSYDLHFCDTPDGEPTCIPFRPTEYDGMTMADDTDGDGIMNDADNCPDVFNPVRPVDEDDMQPDFDSDGAGDVCDPCPLDVSDTCTPFDRDGDGLDSDEDNCPTVANPGQEDVDLDGIGDVCDPCDDRFDADNDGIADECDLCPDFDNTNTNSCPVSIYDIKQGNLENGTAAIVSGVVHSVVSDGIFVAVPDDELDPTLGRRYSGLFVYTGNSSGALPTPAVGDLVEAFGLTNFFFGQYQLESVSDIAVVGSGTVPEPVVVAPSEIGSGGSVSVTPAADADAWEGSLVRVETADITESFITSRCVEFSPGCTDMDFVVGDILRVGDRWYVPAEAPLVGDAVTITAPLIYYHNDFKLAPRSAADLVFDLNAPPSLVGLGPDDVFIETSRSVTQTTPPLTITLNRPAPEGGTQVQVSSSDPTRAIPPSVRTIPEGLTTITVPFTTGTVPGSVEVTATLGSRNFSVDVHVFDPDAQRTVTDLRFEEANVRIDEATTLVVTIDAPAPNGGAIVALNVEEGAATLPAEVSVAQGMTSATVQVTPSALGTLVVEASAGASTAEAVTNVIDGPVLGLVLSEVFYDSPGEDDRKEWVELYNGSGATIDLAAYSLGAGGTVPTYSTLQLSGVVNPGDCVVVGGPISSSDNGLPIYLLPVDFNPDLQNSNSAGVADGVGLFALPVTELEESSVPVDIVLYGATNSSNLLGPDGTPSIVHVGDASSGSSVERVVDQWQIQSSPTPGDCSALF